MVRAVTAAEFAAALKLLPAGHTVYRDCGWVEYRSDQVIYRFVAARRALCFHDTSRFHAKGYAHKPYAVRTEEFFVNDEALRDLREGRCVSCDLPASQGHRNHCAISPRNGKAA